MNKLSIAIHRAPDGKLTLLYVGENADEANKAYRACDDVGEAAIYIQPAPTYHKNLRKFLVRQAEAKPAKKSKKTDSNEK